MNPITLQDHFVSSSLHHLHHCIHRLMVALHLSRRDTDIIWAHLFATIYMTGVVGNSNFAHLVNRCSICLTVLLFCFWSTSMFIPGIWALAC
ncbi:hypothetical protein BDW62DRAFT_193297 [Aspergillus aurantiobrunneus]